MNCCPVCPCSYFYIPYVSSYLPISASDGNSAQDRINSATSHIWPRPPPWRAIVRSPRRWNWTKCPQKGYLKTHRSRPLLRPPTICPRKAPLELCASRQNYKRVAKGNSNQQRLRGLLKIMTSKWCKVKPEKFAPFSCQTSPASIYSVLTDHDLLNLWGFLDPSKLMGGRLRPHQLLSSERVPEDQARGDQVEGKHWQDLICSPHEGDIHQGSEPQIHQVGVALLSQSGDQFSEHSVADRWCRSEDAGQVVCTVLSKFATGKNLTVEETVKCLELFPAES